MAIYCIKGYDSKGYPRYIQDHGSNPSVTTRLGYRAVDQIVFNTQFEAYYFLENFVNAHYRSTTSKINWSIVEYRPIGGLKGTSTIDKDIIIEYTRKLYPYFTIYGPAYKLITNTTVKNFSLLF